MKIQTAADSPPIQKNKYIKTHKQKFAFTTKLPVNCVLIGCSLEMETNEQVKHWVGGGFNQGAVRLKAVGALSLNHLLILNPYLLLILA